MYRIFFFIFIFSAIFLFFVSDTQAQGYDFSTPLATISTLEREISKGNYELYDKSTYLSPALIQKIPQMTGLSYEDYRLCTNKLSLKAIESRAYNQWADNLAFDRIEVTKEEVIDSRHVYLEYKIYYFGTNELTNNRVEAHEDRSFFIKFDDDWWLDLEPELAMLKQEKPSIKLCPSELKGAVELEKAIGLETTWSSDDVRAEFPYQGKIVKVGFWDDDFDYFEVTNPYGEPVGVFYQITIYDLMEVRSFANPDIKDELVERFDYIIRIADLLDQQAPGKYFITKSHDTTLMLNIKEFDSPTLTFATQRLYEPGEERLDDHVIYRNVKPVVVTLDLEKQTVGERDNVELIERHQSAEKKKTIRRITGTLTNIKNNWYKILGLFIAHWCLSFALVYLMVRLLKVGEISKEKITLTVLPLSILRIAAQVFLVMNYVQIGLGGLAVGLMGFLGLLYGVIISMVAADVIVAIVAYFVFRRSFKTKRWKALLITVAFTVLSIVLVQFLYNMFFI